MSSEEIKVPGWPVPRGYSNGRTGRGQVVHIAGQIGWDEHGKLVSPDLVPQFARALDNVLTVLRAAGGVPGEIATMTIYVTDMTGYRVSQREIGAAWRDRLGRHYPAAALIGVASLVEPGAVVEIQATAYIADTAGAR